MRLLPLRCAVLFILLVAGCEHDCFEVEVTPHGREFDRKITCWRVDDENRNKILPVSPEALSRLAKLYSKSEAPTDSKKRVFVGQFTGKTPNDVGGAGSLVYFSSPLGSVSCYVERFRGSDDIEANLADCRRAADQLVDLLIGWLSTEAGQDPRFAQLKAFLDKDLRQDIKNLGLYRWTAEVTHTQDIAQGEFLVRIGLYLHERGYFKVEDIPKLARATKECEWTLLTAHVQRFLASKMGVSDDEPIPPSLAIFTDLARLEASFDKYVRATGLFQRRLADSSRGTAETAPDATETTPGGLVVHLLLASIFRDEAHVANVISPDSADTLSLKLRCGQQPFATNGTWDEEIATVLWNASLDTYRALPTVCFASWSEPDRAFQEKHFGKVLLDGVAMAKFAVWYCTLTPGEAKQWDQFVLGLTPDADLKSAIETFRFSTDPQQPTGEGDQKAQVLADTGRDIILERLKALEIKPK